MNIYIIAGPPGIGKSTSSFKYIPKKIKVIDHDLAAYQYKKEGFVDYNEMGILSGNQQIRSNLFDKKDFALEELLHAARLFSYSLFVEKIP